MAALAFSAPEVFHRTTRHLIAGAALGGLAAGLLPAPHTPVGGVPFFAGALVLGAAAALAGHGALGWRGALGGVALGLAAALLGGLFGERPLFALASIGALAGAAAFRLRVASHPPELPGPRPGGPARLASVLAGAVTMVLAAFTLGGLQGARVLEPWLPWEFAQAGYGAVLGIFLALGAAGSHLAPDPDPVERLFGELAAELSGEFRAIAARAIETYRQALAALGAPEGPARRELARRLAEVTSRCLDLARRWQEVERALGAGAEAELVRRREELHRLGEATTDEAARRQYRIADATIEDELAALARVRIGRERVVARLHGQLALLERARFSLVGLRSSDAQSAAFDLGGIADGLDRVARELDVEAEALDEAHAAA